MASVAWSLCPIGNRERERDTKQATKERKPLQTVIGAVQKMKQNDETENTRSRARGKEIPDWLGGKLSKK